MGNFTFDEINLMCIYNTGTRQGLMDALKEMREYLEPDETELTAITDSALEKFSMFKNRSSDLFEAVSCTDFSELFFYIMPFVRLVGHHVFSPFWCVC